LIIDKYIKRIKNPDYKGKYPKNSINYEPYFLFKGPFGDFWWDSKQDAIKSVYKQRNNPEYKIEYKELFDAIKERNKFAILDRKYRGSSSSLS
jgi:hypothetical protein